MKEKEEKGHRVEIIVAVLGLAGVLATAVISNVDKLVQRPATDTHSSAKNDTQTPETPPKNVDPLNSGTPPKEAPAELPAEKLAEQLVSRFMGAMLSRDVNTLVTIAGVPYYYGGEVLTREEDIRTKYAAFFSTSGSELKDSTITSVTVKTIAARRSEGYDPRTIPRLNSLLNGVMLSDDDFMGLVTLTHGERQAKVAVFVRRLGKELKVAGTMG